MQPRIALLCACWWAAALGQTFEAASVKPAQTGSRARPGMRGGPGTADPGRITFTSVTLAAVIQRAYEVRAYQVAGPDWLNSERYDLTAKIAPGATRDQFDQMLQNVLAGRFHLALHHESRQIQGFELVTAKSGPKLKAARESDQSAPPAPDPSSPPKTDANGFPVLEVPGLIMMEGVRGTAVISYLAARSQPLSALADVLSKEFRLPILDQTGLTGKFDFTLEFAPQPPGALPSPPSMEGGANSPDESGPNLITAVQQQLGLKLAPRKVPLDVLVVDRMERVPIEN